MHILNISKNFDYIYLDAKSSSINIHDINKLVENSYIQKVVIKNWNKNYIAANYRALYQLKSNATLQFSMINASSVDIMAMQAFLAQEDIPKEVSAFDVSRSIFVPQWINRINNILVWDQNLFYNNSFSFTVSKYVNQYPSAVKKVVIFPNNLSSLDQASLSTLMNMNGMEQSFVSSYAGSVVSKYGVDTIWPISVSSYRDIDNLATSLRSYLDAFNILSVMIIFSDNINKSSLSLEEYYSISNLENYVNVYLYGLPVDKAGKASRDLDRFKWISDVKYSNYFKSGVNVYNKNNINFILLK